MKKKIIYRVENEEGEGPYMNLVMDYVEERLNLIRLAIMD
jgi:hypothetical protein